MSGWIVGVDAGGTTSRALARHLVSGETRTAEAAGANWTVHGPEECRGRLAEVVRSALPTGEEPDSLALCLAGFYPPDHAEEASTWAASEWRKSRVRVEPDYSAAWAGAFGGKPGIIVISGTGSIAYGRNAAGDEARAGGWGPLFGDEGSAYWIGRQTLSLLAHDDDQGRPQTRLFERLHAAYPQLGADRRTWLRGVYREGWGRVEIAALAAHLEEHQQQSKRASQILQLAGKELASLVRTVHLRLGSPPLPVALLGGVGERFSAVRTSFAASMPPEVEVIAAESGPLEGALLLAS